MDLSTTQADFPLIKREINVSRGIHLKLRIYMYVIMFGISTKHQACRKYVNKYVNRCEFVANVHLKKAEKWKCFLTFEKQSQRNIETTYYFHISIFHMVKIVMNNYFNNNNSIYIGGLVINILTINISTIRSTLHVYK